MAAEVGAADALAAEVVRVCVRCYSPAAEVVVEEAGAVVQVVCVDCDRAAV